MNYHLESALEKFNSNKEMDFSLELNDFICQAYVKLNPNSYGMQIQEKLRQTLSVKNVPASLGRGDYEFNNKYAEVKVSFLSGKTDSYNITHLRLWQQINLYLFCFIDCEDNFKPNFYLIDKNIINKLKLGFMNGTPEANLNNQNVELRATVKTDSENMKVIRKFNLLNGTSIESLKDYLKK